MALLNTCLMYLFKNRISRILGGTAVRRYGLRGYPVLVAKRNPETMVKSCCNLRALGKGKGLAHGLNGR